MALSDAIERIEATYGQDSPWPPRAFNDFSLRSREFSAVFGRDHDADGTHNNALIAHAGAVCLDAGGFSVYSEGMDIHPIATGIYRVELWVPMRSHLEWGVIVHVQRTAGSGYYGGGGIGVELGTEQGNDKTETTTMIRFTDGLEGQEFDPLSFVVHAYGRRAENY